MQTIFKWRNELLVEVKMGHNLKKASGVEMVTSKFNFQPSVIAHLQLLSALIYIQQPSNSLP